MLIIALSIMIGGVFTFINIFYNNDTYNSNLTDFVTNPNKKESSKTYKPSEKKRTKLSSRPYYSEPRTSQSQSNTRGSVRSSSSRRLGSVLTLQKILQTRRCNVGRIDGILGPQTLQAIEQYQITNKRFEFDKTDIGSAIDYLKRNKGYCGKPSKPSFKSGVYNCKQTGKDSIKLTFLNSELTHIFLRDQKFNVAKHGRLKLNEKLFFESYINYSNRNITVGILHFSNKFDKIPISQDKIIFSNDYPKFKARHYSQKISDLGEISSSRVLLCQQ